jgi:HSP20 family protein
MLTRWNTSFSDYDDMFSTISQLRQYMDRMFDETSGDDRSLPSRGLASQLGGSWPRANLVDAGNQLLVTAEVPGLADKDIKLTLNQDVLTISGERSSQPPEGYSVHRRERPSIQFSRSFSLPCRVDADRTSAVVRNGMLSVTLEKSSDAIPRQITVKAR